MQEMSARSSLESTKLNLMTDISNLRIKLTGAENDIGSLKERAIQAEVSLSYCQLNARDEMKVL